MSSSHRTPVVIRQAPRSSRRTRYNLLLAVASDGSQYNTVFDKPINGTSFSDFLSQLPYPSGTCILLDNACFHHTPASKNTANTKGYHLIYLPPYSPELNPVELAFAAMKNRYYRLRMQPDYQHSPQVVTQLIDDSLKPSSIMGFFREANRYISRLKDKLVTCW